MTMKEAFILYWTGIFDYNRRSRRSEYWLLLLANFFIVLAIGAIYLVVSISIGIPAQTSSKINSIVQYFSYCISFLPSMAIYARRFQDINIDKKWAIIISLFSLVIYILDNTILNDVKITSGFLSVSWIIVLIIDGILALFVLIVMFIPGTKGTNKYGRDPKEGKYDEVF